MEITMIDWDRVQELKDEIGEDDFAEVIELFLAETEDVVDRLINAPQPNRYEEDMHFLKSAALNLGFRTLSQLCSEREYRAAHGEADSIDIAPVIQSFWASKDAFRAGRAMG